MPILTLSQISNESTEGTELGKRAEDLSNALKEGTGELKDCVSNLKFEADKLPTKDNLNATVDRIHAFVTGTGRGIVSYAVKFVEAAKAVSEIQNELLAVIDDAQKFQDVLDSREERINFAKEKLNEILTNGNEWNNVIKAFPKKDDLKLEGSIKKEDIVKDNGAWKGSKWLDKAENCLSVFEGSGKTLSGLKSELEKINKDAQSIKNKSDVKEEDKPRFNIIKQKGEDVYDVSRLMLELIKAYAFSESYLSKLILGIYKVLV